MKVLILGASGGIGLAVAQKLISEPDYQVIATYHSNRPEDTGDVEWIKFNAKVESDYQGLALKCSEVDWIINCIGMLHTSTQGPEKSISQFDFDHFQNSISLNTLPTLAVGKYFQSALKSSQSPRLVTISAKVGSISDNQLGGWYSYRASKAALNMAIKTLSIEWKRTFPKACVLAFHPGTTDTALSKPFQKNVPKGKLFTPDYVASQLIDLVKEATPEKTGRFYSYSGEELPW